MVMESEIGGTLLTRTKRNVELTAAGKMFFDACQRILNDYNHGLSMIKVCENGNTDLFRIGFASYTAQLFLPKIIETTKQQFPNVEFQLYDKNYIDVVSLIQKGTLDFGIVPYVTDTSLCSRIIMKDEYCFVVPPDHWASSLEKVSMDEILSEKFLTIDRFRTSESSNITNHNLLSHVTDNNNYRLNIVGTADSMQGLLLMISCGYGVTIIAKHIHSCINSNVRFIPIKGLRPYYSYIVWKSTPQKQSSAQVIHYINSIFDSTGIIEI